MHFRTHRRRVGDCAPWLTVAAMDSHAALAAKTLDGVRASGPLVRSAMT